MDRSSRRQRSSITPVLEYRRSRLSPIPRAAGLAWDLPGVTSFCRAFSRRDNRNRVAPPCKEAMSSSSLGSLILKWQEGSPSASQTASDQRSRRPLISVSTGTATCPDDGKNAEALLEKADVELYKMKSVYNSLDAFR